MKQQLGLVLLGALVAAAVLLGITSTRPSAAPTGVQVASLWGSVEMQPNKPNQADALASYTFPVPVTIIGVEGFAELYLLNTLTLGNLQALTLVSSGSTWSSPGSLFEVGTIIAGTSVTASGVTAAVSMGQPLVFDRMMFPAGQGIDFNAGETVYLNALDNNNMTRLQRGWHAARIYYVFK